MRASVGLRPSQARHEALQQELQRIVDLLVRSTNPRAVVVFGSMASGNVEEWSDIELLVVRETDKKWLDRVRELLLVARPRLAVDIIVLTPAEWEEKKRNDPFFREEILERGRVVYGSA